MKKKILFILGTAHCGSTLLSLILDSSEQCFTVGELSNLPTIYKKEQSSTQNHDFWHSQFSETEKNKLILGLSNARISPMIPLKIEKSIREMFNDKIFRPYSLIQSKTSAEIIVDSTKTIYWISNMLQLKELKQEYDVFLLHLVRDGRAVLNSYLRKRKKMTVEQFSNLWLQRVRDNEQFFQNFNRGKKIQLAYEELATNPYSTTQKVCDFLNIKFVPDLINYWKYEHYMLSGNRGTKSLVETYKSSSQSSPKNQQDLSIKLDLSWKSDLTEERLAQFYSMIGDKNEPYEWN
jgi:hypothetical protein